MRANENRQFGTPVQTTARTPKPAVCHNGWVVHDRNQELGDCCAFCLGCGWGRRFMGGHAAGVPAACPDCGGAVLSACPDCGHPIRSLMALTCAGCGARLRDDSLFGETIRRKPERHRRTVALDGGAVASDNEMIAS